MKRILVFKNGVLFKNILYKTKSLAKKHLVLYRKHGMLDPETGFIVPDLTFELL